MDALTVLREIITFLNIQDCHFLLIEHSVGVNWRQRYRDLAQKVANLDEALRQDLPSNLFYVSGRDIMRVSFSPVTLLSSEKNVISIASLVYPPNSWPVHLPLMNFHPHAGIGLNEIQSFMARLSEGHRGKILATGRFWHFYGSWILTEEDWLRFNCQCLMPTIFVSERYIGHSIFRGYNLLRLTASEPFKPVIPYVVAEV